MAVVIGQYLVTNNSKNRLDYGYGLKYPLIMSEQTFAVSYDIITRLKSNLTILLSTKVGERVAQPFFGTTLHKLIFEPESEELNQKIFDSIASAVARFVPQVTIEGIEVSREQNLLERGIMEVNVDFRANSTGETFDVNFNVTA